MTTERRPKSNEDEVRNRILEAAFLSFMKKGYAATSILEIATRAHVSKREIYALVGNKQKMLITCITERSKRFQILVDLPVPPNHEILAHILTAFGKKLIHEVSDPVVISVFRLAIAEAINAPEVAQTLNSVGRAAGRAALYKIMTQAQASGLIHGCPAELAEQFSGLLWTDLMVSLLLGVAERPVLGDIEKRAHNATTAFLQLHRHLA